MSDQTDQTDLGLRTLDAEALALARAIHRGDERAVALSLRVLMAEVKRKGLLPGIFRLAGVAAAWELQGRDSEQDGVEWVI